MMSEWVHHHHQHFSSRTKMEVPTSSDRNQLTPLTDTTRRKFDQGKYGVQWALYIETPLIYMTYFLFSLSSFSLSVRSFSLSFSVSLSFSYFSVFFIYESFFNPINYFNVCFLSLQSMLSSTYENKPFKVWWIQLSSLKEWSLGLSST
jgi:hypothetical protein